MNFLWFKRCVKLDIHIRRRSIIFPLWFKHLKSHNNDSAIKRLIALHDIVALSYLTEFSLYRTGFIDLNLSSEKLANIDDILISLNALFNLDYRNDLSIFLSTQQFSGIFHCTSDDYADAHITTIHFLLLQPLIPGWDSYWFKMWAKSLLKQNPSATPALLTALESAAQEFHEKDHLNKSLTRQAEEYLLGWLKKLPDPPESIINAWQKAFSKAQDAAETGNNPGYYSLLYEGSPFLR
ncbi:hypothetical protein BDQ17DRAFT_880977 [Cyathus striatus]|nr:hypothetical protein BDQ17DRAFT_880977 [Cyathus striatus]